MESRLKNPEHYYMTLLQLYMPWRDEDNLKGTYRTFEEKYLNVESVIMPNILKHNKYFETFDIDDDILDNQYDYSSSNDSSDNDDENEFSMLNPDLIDFDNRAGDDPVVPLGTFSSSTARNVLPFSVMVISIFLRLA